MDERTEADGIVRNGIDVLIAGNFSTLRHKRLGLVTNHTGLTSDGRRTIDVLRQRDDLYLDRLFAPEHGLSGLHDERVADGVDEASGLVVHSLFNARADYRPTAEQLHGLDVILYDIQDIGCRFYTYLSTLGYLLEASAENGVAVYVLDRPNPIDGLDVEGPCSDPEVRSFIGFHSIPLRHGMTVGEMARLFNVERRINADLRVVTMAGWERHFLHGDTGQRWVNPSPNIRDVTAAGLFPGVGLLECTNVSVGRGTPSPFHVFGAPWIDGDRLAGALAEYGLPALRFEAVTFVPDDFRHMCHGQTCHGVRFIVDDLLMLESARLGLALIQSLRSLYPTEWEFVKLDSLLLRPDLMDAIEDRSPDLDDLWEPDPEFFEARASALLY
ncbi:MAG: DUF1343 domain-containing protein [Candidatus Eremiobacteraeota bacterium]|nr:DUF1343 domain-containing protein [Candidatus Eremiobacteraeota bacterium]MBC5828475.1 DUF1343 domain-containing protein [Candidatus Eremiobacteraeota bacterium]